MPGLRFNLEVCADSIESALIAQEAGACRVEFCKALLEGGITPSYGQIELLRKYLNIKLYVLIRPRGGDFFYTKHEVEAMKKDIEICGELGCDGVVTGLLNTDGSIDKTQSAYLIERARQIDIHSLIGVISLPNEASQKLHKKFNFELIGNFRESGVKFGKLIDVEFWQLIL